MVITVQCPTCETSFPVDPAKVPEGGVNARCSVCSAIFRVESAPEVEAAPVQDFEAPPETAPPPVEPEVAEAAEPTGFESTDSRVFDTEQDGDVSELDVEPMGTVESTSAGSRQEVEADAQGGTSAFAFETESPVEEEPSHDTETVSEWPPLERETAGLEADGQPEVVWEEPEAEAVPEPEAPRGRPQGFTFGHRDPHDKARRLARVLVSDMIMYNPDRHERALAGGTLKEDFDEEIAKSWKEYVDQVGEELAHGTSYWLDALNEVLAKGERIF